MQSPVLSVPDCSVGILIPGCHAEAEMIHCPSVILLGLASSSADDFVFTPMLDMSYIRISVAKAEVLL